MSANSRPELLVEEGSKGIATRARGPGAMLGASAGPNTVDILISPPGDTACAFVEKLGETSNADTEEPRVVARN